MTVCMRKIAQTCLVMCIGWLASCSSSDSTNGSGSAGGSAGAGGSTQGDCSTMECFRPYNCVTVCGGMVVRSGCCACEAPLFDNLQCARDAANPDSTSGQSDASDGGK